MCNSNYKPREVLSPFQPSKILPTEIQVRQINYKIQDIVKKLCREYSFKAVFEQDSQMAEELPNLTGLVCLKCKLLNNKNEVIAVGRSCGIFAKSSYAERSISNILNGCFLSACNNLTKLLEALRNYDENWYERLPQQVEPEETTDRPTDKQILLIEDLLSEKSLPPQEREQKLRDIRRMSKIEASNFIGQLLASK